MDREIDDFTLLPPQNAPLEKPARLYVYIYITYIYIYR